MSALHTELRGLAARALAVMPSTESNAPTRKLLLVVVCVTDDELRQIFTEQAALDAIETLRPVLEDAEVLKRELEREGMH